MSLKAVVFDFDGTILDTESPDFQAWCEVYASHGQELDFEMWCTGVGTTQGGFDPYGTLEALIQSPLDRDDVRRVVRARNLELIGDLALLEGVEARLEEARELGLGIAIASSASLDWVSGHLERYNLTEYFHAVVCAGKDLPAKPNPAVYLTALEWLGATPQETVAFEDSPHGIAAAKAAGLTCVAVPNAITSRLDFSLADRIVASLGACSLRELANTV
jgi:HAD superfamily hydrolase (TIGR01509 family)